MDVLFVDDIEGTNKEESPLFTVYVRNSIMKQDVILIAVLPNNKRWVYRWIREVVISDLLGYQF